MNEILKMLLDVDTLLHEVGKKLEAYGLDRDTDEVVKIRSRLPPLRRRIERDLE